MFEQGDQNEACRRPCAGARSALACLACKLRPITDMALPSVRDNVDDFQERRFEPAKSDGADQWRRVDCVPLPL